MKKKIALALACVLTLTMILTGCGSRPLPSGMDQDAVGAEAERLLDLLLAEDYQSVADAFRDDLREEYAVTADTVKEAMDAADGARAYVQTSSVLVVGGKKSKKTFQEDYAVAVLYCEHEEKAVIYEFSFDTDLKLIGLAVKPK
jgi:hypothetical protein